MNYGTDDATQACGARLVGNLGHLALAAVFVRGGSRVFRAPDGPAVAVADFLGQVKARIAPVAKLEDRQLVRLNAAVQVVGGVGLAVGKLPRLSSLALIGSMAPTTLAAFPFWRQDAGPDRFRMEGEFLKNVALVGGLVGVLVER